jgi:membrane fusion protein (multidrug efflux system)
MSRRLHMIFPLVAKAPAALLATLLFVAPFLRAEDEEEKVETEVAVEVGKITRATLRRAITAYGVIEPEAGNAPASARLAPAVPGIITEVNGVEGKRVEKGDILFRLDSRAADAAVAKAQMGIDFAQKNSERQKKLIAAEGTSEKLVLEAQQALAAAQTELAAAKVQQSLLRGEAPLAGTIVRFTARPGEAADITVPLVEIVDLDRLVASVHVPSAEAAEVRAEQNAQILPANGAAPIDCKVTLVIPQVDPATDSVLVRLAVPKGGGVLLGQPVIARIFCEEHKDCLAVPFASVVKDGEGGATIALVEDGKATRRPIKTGLRENELIEVEGEGLSAGQTVVTVGAYGLPKETRVRVRDAGAK